MRSPAVVSVLLLIGVACVSPGAWAASSGGQTAMEHLLGILSERAVLTREEAEAVRQTLQEEQRRLAEQEQEIEEKRRALSEWERALEERERALGTVGSQSQPLRSARGGSERAETLVPLWDGGFRLDAPDGETFSLGLGGLLQSDYRYYHYPYGDPDNNAFDLRRVRLVLGGTLYRLFDYKFEYEFQGAGSRRLMDAYVDFRLRPGLSFRIGQYKEPFGFEQYTRDRNLFFAERSMGWYLTPQRDLGFMVHGSVFSGRIVYGAGLFNGDGFDDAAGGDEDAPEITGRVVLAPFRHGGWGLLQGLQLGGSASYGDIDRNNVEIHVKTAGLTPFLDIASGAKFNVIRDAGTRRRYGLELAWVAGPVALSAEHIRLKYKDITTSSDRFSVEMEDSYIALLWMLTGEQPVLQDGCFAPALPRAGFPEDGWGALGLALRYDLFEAEPSVYDTLIMEGISVRRARGYSLALNWFLNRAVRLTIDATRTEFDMPLLIDRDPITGEAVYSDREDVLTGRLQFGF